MTLADTGPLVALIDPRDPNHRRCADALERLSSPFLTTWPAFTEAMYFLGDAAGWAGQTPLWQMRRRGDLTIAESSEASIRRTEVLMETYRDVPMDLADASLVALAEERGFTRIFTLDRHFQAYRLHGRKRFALIP